ncbi:MAG: glycoside hydrolase family 9 protein [Microthrixaceae bacterium]
MGKGDLTGLDTWRMDFGGLTAAGRFRVCVEGIGCSYPFSVDDDDTWARASATVARSLYYQRSDIALGAPTASFDRPRVDHPADGLVVHESTLTALEAADLPDDQLFKRLVAGAGRTVVKGAWGGHFDAGDWDRRTSHLFMARDMLDALRIAPDRFEKLNLDIPESGDDVPDLLDEAMWTIDLFRRMQRSDGAVRGGIESAEFPKWGVPSFRDDLARYAYAPDPWTGFAYAATAAQAAQAMQPYDGDRAGSLRRSALAAYEWSARQAVPTKYRDKVAAQRGVADASLLVLTGEPRWNEAFVADAPFKDGPLDVLSCHFNEWCDAGWQYLWAAPDQTDAGIRSNIAASFTGVATRIADAAATTRFGFCTEDPGVPLEWGLGAGGTPHAVTLLRAYLIDGDTRFLETAQRCAAVGLGDNPLDTSLVTGLGAQPVRHPLIVDVNVGGLPAWPGTPVYGFHRLGGDQQWVIDYRLKPAGTSGDLSSIPYLQSWFDLGDVGPMDEFTVDQSQAPTLWVFGVLASKSPHRPI